MGLSFGLGLPPAPKKGVGGVPLPTGALGAWYADTYAVGAGGQKYAPNSASPGAASPNVLTASRRMFAVTEWWTGTSVTLTDDAATAPDGSNDATTAVATGNWTLKPVNSGSLPAGTYTVAVNAKRNTGSDQLFCFTMDNTSTRSAQQTTTSAWQRFSYTFTLAAPAALNVIAMCSIDGSTAANLQICDFEIFLGASDLGPNPPVGNLVLNQSAYQTTASYSSGYFNLSTGGYALIQMPSSTSLTNFTAMSVVSRVAAGSAYKSFLSKVKSYLGFSLYTELSGNALTQITGPGPVAYNQLAAATFNLLNVGPHLISHRYDGTYLTFWLDDIQLLKVAASVTSTAVQDLFVGLTNSTALTSGNKVNAIALWQRSLSDLEMRAAFAHFTARAATDGITLSSERVFGNVGDSITGGQSYCYPYLYPPNANPPILGADYAVSGSTLATLNAQAATIDAVIPPNKGSRKFILSVLIGANDLGAYSGGAAQYLIDLAAYCDARRAAGWIVVVCTILPISGNATFNTRRAIVNAAITSSWTGVHCDAVSDFAGNAIMGPDDSYTVNPTYWTDITHPSALGQAVLETVIRPVVNAL